MLSGSETIALNAGMAYDRMVEDILAGIHKGRLREGQRLPGEAKLKEQYGISVNSIKTGLHQLVERGVLRRKRGSGTYVASVEAAAPPTFIPRDTIAIVCSWAYWNYHPFFSELFNGLRAGLASRGWNHLDLLKENRGGDKPHKDISHTSLQPEVLIHQLKRYPNVGGIVCINNNPDIDQAMHRAGVPVVSTEPTFPGPSIAYDWDAEIERLFRIALQQGARKLGVVGSMPEATLSSALQSAARAAGLKGTDVTLTCLPCGRSHNGSEIIAAAYGLIRELFARPTALDGLVITGDYEAQGVTDALLLSPEAHWRSLPIVALLNKETRLRARLPMTALVADGYAYGLALAELIHDKTIIGKPCPSHTTLACNKQEWQA